MDYTEAKDLAEKIIDMAEDNDVDHHSVEEIRQGNKRYIEVKISIKIK